MVFDFPAKLMRLLFVLPEYSREPVGGIRTFYVNLLPSLVQAGCQIKVLLARREFCGKESFVDALGVEVEYVRADLLEKHDQVYHESQFVGNWLLGQFVPVANAAFEQVRGGEGFDMVEVTDWPLLFLPWVAQLKPKVPFTISLHSSVGQMVEYEAKRDGGYLDFALVRMFEAMGFASAPSIHANSNLNAKYWEKITNRMVDVLLPLMGKNSLTTENTECTELEAGAFLASQAGAYEPDSLASELADSPVSESLSRSARGPASSADTAPEAPMLDPRPSTLDSAPRLRGAVFARLQNWKGCEILAEALAECPEIEIHWYGADIGNTAEERKWSESLARNFPKVFGQNFLYKGVVEPARVPDLMAQADFVCVPSLWDVFNLSAVEAMESGKVVLCSRQAGAEMLIEDGVNGFLFDPDRPGELAEKLKQIARLSSEDRKKIGRVARESVREKLQPERLISQRIDYYRGVATQKLEENRNCFLPDILEPKTVAAKSLGQKLYRWRKKVGICGPQPKK